MLARGVQATHTIVTACRQKTWYRPLQVVFASIVHKVDVIGQGPFGQTPMARVVMVFVTRTCVNQTELVVIFQLVQPTNFKSVFVGVKKILVVNLTI